MKLIRFLVVVGFLAICASAARADSVDPIITTRGCGGTSPCDAVILGPGQTVVSVPETFSCPSDSTTCTASESVINETGADITSFTLAWQTTGLSFTCNEGGFFICTQVTSTTETFTGGPICSTDSNDVSVSETGAVTFTPDSDADDTCNFGVTINLTANASEGIVDQERITSTFVNTTPEPSSALLLLFGLMGGLVSFKFLRNTSLL